MKNNVDALLQQSLEGHRVMAKIHGESHDLVFHRMASLIEMKTRGVRFLPAQVVKRAIRKIKQSRTAIN